MNERIRNLQIQAFAECKTFEDDKIRTDEVFERFAELIVQDCMRMCDVAQVGYLTHGHTLQGEGCQGAKRYIAVWFGVEE